MPATRAPELADSSIKGLLIEAETSAERVVGFVRCAIGFAASLMFFTVVVPKLAPDSPTRAQIPFIAIFSIGYLAVGLVSLAAARPGRFRGWMTWVFTTLDIVFWGVLMVSAIFNIVVPANYIIISPPVVVTAWLLALVALRTNPLLQTYALVFILALLVALFVLAPAVPPDHVRFEALLFQVPQSVIRLSILTFAGITLVYLTLRTRQLLVRAIGETVQRINLTRYLPPQLAGRMAASDEDRLMSGAVQDAAVMFVDIRGFTSLAESLDPSSLSRFLSEFRGIVSTEIHACNGIVDKFVGDSVMAVFGAPDRVGDPAADAVASAGRIVEAMKRWNELRQASGQTAVRIGVSMHWGEVFCGAVGDRARLEFTVLGDSVNVAARLQEATKTTGLTIVTSQALLTAAGLEAAPDKGWAFLDEIEIRGRTGKMKVYGR